MRQLYVVPKAESRGGAPLIRGAQGLEHCLDCAIRHRAVCTYCTPEELQDLEQLKSYRRYAPGQEIVAAGETMTHVGTVVEGVVSLSKTLPDGRRQTVGLMFASDFLGRPLRAVAPYDAVAATEVRLCLFSRARFERLLAETPELERRLLEMALDELDAAREWMLLLGRKTATERIASFLMLIARRQSDAAGRVVADGMTIDLPLTREAIADFLGLTIETVSRQLTQLKKAGAIALPDLRRCVIPRLDVLRALAGDGAEG